MKCIKCGKELNEGDKFCRDCGQKVEDVKQSEAQNSQSQTQSQVQTQEVVKEEKRIVSSMENDTFLCIISLACYFGGPIITWLLNIISYKIPFMAIFNRITSLLPLFAFGLVIYTKVKYPKSTFAKTLLIIYIVLFAISLILLFVFIVSCIKGLSECSNIGLIFN